MPALTNIEETLLTELETKATALKQAEGADSITPLMSDVVGDTARVVVAMARTGGVGWAECYEFRQTMREAIKKGSSGWAKTLAMFGPPSAGAVLIAFKIISELWP